MTNQLAEDEAIKSPEMVALDAAIEACNGAAKFAARIGVALSSPSMWKTRRRVPAEHCPAIERETGIPCERLRPDVPWDVLRMQAGKDDTTSLAKG